VTSSLVQLAHARRVADYASSLGAQSARATPRLSSNHLGAVVADAVLQAGVNYRTVVERRVTRIRERYPQTATLDGLLAVVEHDGISDFLLWNHSTKLVRFSHLVRLLAEIDIRTTDSLREWLPDEDARIRLMSLHGIGPKTYDYMCCLVGIDRIAVDRHVRTFAANAGVATVDYGDLQIVVSYAADLLGIARRDFDAWIWATVSSRVQCQNLALAF
jgi:endonuclease III